MKRKDTLRSTVAQKIAIHELLKLHLVKNEDGTCEYKDDWSDSQIAQAVSKDLGPNHVQLIRIEMFGQLKRSSTLYNVLISELKTQVSELKDKNDHLAKRLEILEQLHGRLCTNLALNKVMDARHLEGGRALDLAAVDKLRVAR